MFKRKNPRFISVLRFVSGPRFISVPRFVSRVCLQAYRTCSPIIRAFRRCGFRIRSSSTKTEYATQTQFIVPTPCPLLPLSPVNSFPSLQSRNPTAHPCQPSTHSQALSSKGKSHLRRQASRIGRHQQRPHPRLHGPHGHALPHQTPRCARSTPARRLHHRRGSSSRAGKVLAGKRQNHRTRETRTQQAIRVVQVGKTASAVAERSEAASDRRGSERKKSLIVE